jgi:RND family efflux transporter MFP subunit
VSSIRFIVPSLALAALALTACSESKSEVIAEPPQRPVLVQQVRYEPAIEERSFVATVRPRIESDLGFRVGGKVARRLVEVGETVKAGQTLATLDEVDFRLQLDQARAELRAAKGNQLQARADQKRGEVLRKQGWSAEAVLEKQRAATDEADGRVLRAERAVALAVNSLAYASLRADGDGVVTATAVESGQVVAAGQTAIRVARLEEKEAVVAVPEALVDRLSKGKVTVSLWSQPDRLYAAHLRELSPGADPGTRTYQARFTILEAGSDVRLGMTATVILSDPHSGQVARLPLSAVIDEGKGPALFVVDKETGFLEHKPVNVIGYEAGSVLIKSGVKEGEWVVALGTQKLDDAQIVRVVDNLQF